MPCNHLLTAVPSQALLEEIERHGEKVEECQRFAKQYINAIKVRPPAVCTKTLIPGHTCQAGRPGVLDLSLGRAGKTYRLVWEKAQVVREQSRWPTTVCPHRTMSYSWSHTRRNLSQWPLQPRSLRSSLDQRVSSRR